MLQINKINDNLYSPYNVNIYFTAAFILFYFSLPNICKKTLQEKYMGVANAKYEAAKILAH